MGKTYKELSKSEWHKTDESNPTLEGLSFGCLQRIATALENIEWSMTRDRERMDYLEKRINSTNRRLRELKGKRKKP